LAERKRSPAKGGGATGACAVRDCVFVLPSVVVRVGQRKVLFLHDLQGGGRVGSWTMGGVLEEKGQESRG